MVVDKVYIENNEAIRIIIKIRKINKEILD